MSIFKKKKTDLIGEKLAKADFIVIPPDVPEVIKESKIKPTKCKRCLSTYQAKYNHLRSMIDIPGDNRFTECPICHNFNEVEFEDPDDARG